MIDKEERAAIAAEFGTEGDKISVSTKLIAIKEADAILEAAGMPSYTVLHYRNTAAQASMVVRQERALRDMVGGGGGALSLDGLGAGGGGGRSHPLTWNETLAYIGASGGARPETQWPNGAGGPGGAVMFADNGDDIEARMKADAELSCPHCGGSGHRDDAEAGLQKYRKRYEWLVRGAYVMKMHTPAGTVLTLSGIEEKELPIDTDDIGAAIDAAIAKAAQIDGVKP